MNSVFEFAWLATQQVLVSSDDSAEDIKGYGSGFFYSIVISFFLLQQTMSLILMTSKKDYV